MVAVVVAVAAACRSGAGEPSATTEAAEDIPVTAADARIDDAAEPNGEALTVGASPARYRITYRVDETGPIGPPGDREVVWVDGPSTSRIETGVGPTRGLQVITLDRARRGRADAPVVMARVPVPADGVTRLSLVLDAALADGVVADGGLRTVAGRRCRVLRTHDLFGSGPLAPPTDSNHAETCVDEDGLIVAEALVTGGTTTVRREATAIELDPEVDDDAFVVGPLSLGAERVGASRPVDPGAGAEGEFWILPADAVPPGFEHLGRYSIVPPQPVEFADPLQRDRIVAGTADVWRRKDELLVLWQGGTLGRIDTTEVSPGARPVDLGPLGTGHRSLLAWGTRVDVDRPGGRFVQVSATLPPEAVLAVTRALVATTGTGLIDLEEVHDETRSQ